MGHTVPGPAALKRRRMVALDAREGQLLRGGFQDTQGLRIEREIAVLKKRTGAK